MWHEYPYTDAHELNLDWFLKEFKTLVETWEQVQSDWNSLHDYVQNYFDNLNVQSEINNKINAMIADGSFALILTPLVEAALPTIVDGKLPAVVASQIGAVVASQIDTVVAGQLPAVATAAAAQEVGTWLVAHIDPDTGYVIDDTLTVSQAAADAKTVGDEISAIKSEVSDFKEDVFALEDVTYTLTNIPNVTLQEYGRSNTSATEASIEDDNAYDSYYFYVDDPNGLSMYCIPSDGYYYSILKLENPTGNWITHATYLSQTGSNGARYRTLDGNLPTTSDSPLTVPYGTLIVISVPHGINSGIVFMNRLSNTLLNDNLVLNNNQIDQVRAALTQKSMMIKYVSGSGEELSTERVEVYFPQKDGYIKYNFLHSVNASIKCDVWRLGLCHKCNDDLSIDYAITTTGEWELAIKLDGRPDFSGGANHGDEIMSKVEFFVDGENVDITGYTSATKCGRLEVIQYSTLYDPSDEDTAIAYHGSLHDFNPQASDNVIIKQSVKWLGNYNLTNSYMAMFPILKAVSDKFTTNRSWEPTTITLDTAIAGVKEAKIYKDGAAPYASFSHPLTLNYPVSGTLLITDNGGLDYNKCYYIACTSGNTVSTNDLWQTETRYNIQA